MLHTFAEAPRERLGHPRTVLRCGLKFAVPWPTLPGSMLPSTLITAPREVALRAMALTLEVALQPLGRKDC